MSLSELLRDQPVLLVFYPKDFGLICTKQLCAYQGDIEEFRSYGIQVVGISSNMPEHHRAFKEKYVFTFPLLSDPGKIVTKAYGITSLFMLGGNSRAVFIVSKNGKVLYRYVEPTTATFRKSQELLDAIEDLRKSNRLS